MSENHRRGDNNSRTLIFGGGLLINLEEELEFIEKTLNTAKKSIRGDGLVISTDKGKKANPAIGIYAQLLYRYTQLSKLTDNQKSKFEEFLNGEVCADS